MKRNAYFTFLLLTFLLVGRTNGLAQVRTAQTTPAPPDTVKGAALVIVDISVENEDGSERTRFQGVFLPVYRVRQETDAVKINEPTGQVRAYITHYYQRDWTELPKDDVALFLKRDWK